MSRKVERDPRTGPTRTVAYLRVSTAEQAETGISLDAQRAKVQAYAALYALDLVAIEVDAGVSAKGFRGGFDATLRQRPGLARALSQLDRGTADAILVVKLDRLTRSVRDLGTLVERYFANRYALMSVSEQIDTRSAAGRQLVLHVLGAVAAWEREATGERTSAAMAHKRSCAEYTGGEPPYGWRVGDDGSTLKRDQGEQATIRAAVALREAGLSLRQIGAALEKRGLLPRSRRSWHAKTIRGLLTPLAAPKSAHGAVYESARTPLTEPASLAAK